MSGWNSTKPRVNPNKTIQTTDLERRVAAIAENLSAGLVQELLVNLCQQRRNWVILGAIPQACPGAREMLQHQIEFSLL